MSNNLIELTTPQAAAALGVTVTRVNALIKSKQLPARKVGRDYLVDANAVNDRAKNPPSKKGGRPSLIRKSD